MNIREVKTVRCSPGFWDRAGGLWADCRTSSPATNARAATTETRSTSSARVLASSAQLVDGIPLSCDAEPCHSQVNLEGF